MTVLQHQVPHFFFKKISFHFLMMLTGSLKKQENSQVLLLGKHQVQHFCLSSSPCIWARLHIASEMTFWLKESEYNMRPKVVFLAWFAVNSAVAKPKPDHKIPFHSTSLYFIPIHHPYIPTLFFPSFPLPSFCK